MDKLETKIGGLKTELGTKIDGLKSDLETKLDGLKTEPKISYDIGAEVHDPLLKCEFNPESWVQKLMCSELSGGENCGSVPKA